MKKPPSTFSVMAHPDIAATISGIDHELAHLDDVSRQRLVQSMHPYSAIFGVSPDAQAKISIEPRQYMVAKQIADSDNAAGSEGFGIPDDEDRRKEVLRLMAIYPAVRTFMERLLPGLFFFRYPELRHG